MYRISTSIFRLLQNLPKPEPQMKHLFNHKFQTRISLCNPNFVSSLAVVDYPPKLSSENERISSPFDPIRLFNDYAKSGLYTATNTRILHAHLLDRGALRSNVALANSLLDCYCKSGAMDDALQLFDLIPQRNVSSWNILILGYNHNSLFSHSWGVFCRMRSSGFKPNVATYENVVAACSALQHPILTQLVYQLAMKTQFSLVGPVRSRLIGLFTKTCSLEDGLRAFRDVSCTNVVCWNTIISGAVRRGENLIALDIFHEMHQRSLAWSNVTFCIVLSACGAFGRIEIGRVVQGLLVKSGAEDVTAGTALINLYAKCGKMEEAVRQLLWMPSRNVVSWTVVISGFAKSDDSISALKVFREMRKLGEETNTHTLTSVILACGKLDMFESAIQIHSLTLKTGFYYDASVGAALISMYSKLGSVDRSEMVFEEVENLKNLDTWGAMASSLTYYNENSGKVIGLLQRMLQESLRPDAFCTSSALSIIGCLNEGRQIHSSTIKTGLNFNLVVSTSLLRMYSNCGRVDDSYKVFREVVDKDSFCWTSMLASFTEHGLGDQALQLFREMLLDRIVPDAYILNAILTACSAFRSQQFGKEIHGYSLRLGFGHVTEVCNAILNMYSKCGALDSARRVFDMMRHKDGVTCASLASGYAQNGYLEEALQLFPDMVKADLPIDSFTMSSTVRVTALLSRPIIGTQIHARITKMGLHSNAVVGSSLVTMYSESGSFEECRKAFDEIEELDLIGMTSMIMSYAAHGKGSEALRLYETMKKEGIRPDSVTFVGVLSACSDSGLVEEAHYLLHSMTKDYGIEPDCRHYAYMVDLLCRGGTLKEAKKFIDKMPIEPDSAIWRILLRACKVQGDSELGKLAAGEVRKLQRSCFALEYPGGCQHWRKNGICMELCR